MANKLSLGGFVAYRIFVPEAGKYHFNLLKKNAEDGGLADIYFIKDMEIDATTAVPSAMGPIMAKDKIMLNVDFKDSESNSEVSSCDINVEEAGVYVVIIRPIGAGSAYPNDSYPHVTTPANHPLSFHHSGFELVPFSADELIGPDEPTTTFGFTYFDVNAKGPNHYSMNPKDATYDTTGGKHTGLDKDNANSPKNWETSSEMGKWDHIGTISTQTNSMYGVSEGYRFGTHVTSPTGTLSRGDLATVLKLNVPAGTGYNAVLTYSATTNGMNAKFYLVPLGNVELDAKLEGYNTTPNANALKNTILTELAIDDYYIGEITDGYATKTTTKTKTIGTKLSGGEYWFVAVADGKDDACAPKNLWGSVYEYQLSLISLVFDPNDKPDVDITLPSDVMNVGATMQMDVTVSRGGVVSTDPNEVKLVAETPGIASISKAGVIKGLAEGNARFTVSAGKTVKTVYVTVASQTKPSFSYKIMGDVIVPEHKTSNPSSSGSWMYPDDMSDVDVSKTSPWEHAVNKNNSRFVLYNNLSDTSVAAGKANLGDSFFAYRVYVPKAGAYYFNITKSMRSNSGKANIYFAKDAEITASTQIPSEDGAIRESDLVGEVDFYAASNTTGTEKVGVVTVDAPGNYLIVIAPTDDNAERRGGTVTGDTYFFYSAFNLMAAPISNPDLQPGGNDLEYNFISVKSDWKPIYWEGSATPRVEDIRGITYDYTPGNWQYYGFDPTYTHNNNSMFCYSGTYQWARLSLCINKDKWAGLTIKIPAPGKYFATLEYAVDKRDDAGRGEIYLIPYMDDKSEVVNFLTDEYRLGEIDYYADDAVSTTVRTSSLRQIEINEEDYPENGEYLLIFKNTYVNSKYMKPRRLFHEGMNAISEVVCEVDTTELTLGADGGESTELRVSAKKLDGTEIPYEDLRITATTETGGVVYAERDRVQAIGEGETKLTVNVSDGIKTRTVDFKFKVTDTSGVESFEYDVPEFVYVRGNHKLKILAHMNSGNTLIVPSDSISYNIVSSEPEGVAEISEDGVLTGKAEGEVTVTMSATFKGEAIEKRFTAEIKPSGSKTEPTYYTNEMRENVRNNIKKYDWAEDRVASTIKKADSYLENAEEIYNLIQPEGVPRGRQVGLKNDPEWKLCRYCGKDVEAVYGTAGGGGWVIDPLRNKWKIKCPHCSRVFPSNDFASLYELGLDENGNYSAERARAKNQELIDSGFFAGTRREKYGYLTNELYPEASTNVSRDVLSNAYVGEQWGVDDGWGYIPTDENGNQIVYPNGAKAQITYIAEYNYYMWRWLVHSVITNTKDAYLYTGDIKYARFGAALIDRISDILPEMNTKQYTDLGFICTTDLGGYIHGQIDDADNLRIFAQSADAYFPMLDDPELIEFLSGKAEVFGLENDKSSALKIWQQWEENILKETLNGVKKLKIEGNYGQLQAAIAASALALAKEPDSKEMVEYIYASGQRGTSGRIGGGALSETLVGVIDRDGMGDESSPRYNTSWAMNLNYMADALSRYDNGKYSPYNHVKFAKLFTAASPLVLTRTHTAQIGDSGEVAGIELVGSDTFYVDAFINLKDTQPEMAKTIAEYIYARNGYTKKGLEEKANLFAGDPEEFANEIMSFIDEDKKDTSEMMAGYGFAVLRDGVKFVSEKNVEQLNNLRDFWITFGKNGSHISHAHNDTLGLGIEAYGLNFSPDFGYPENTQNSPVSSQWTNNVLSHNVVMVDEKASDTKMTNGFPKHFDDSEQVKLMDVEAPSNIYDSTQIYRRSVVMVKVNDDISYGVDFFRVKGGSSHLYSFHAQAEHAEGVEGLDLVLQQDEPRLNGEEDEIWNEGDTSSYAGPDVKYGLYTANSYPPGYTWLKNVRRDATPENKFAVDFDIEDYRGTIKDSNGIRLRMTMLNDFALTEVAIAGGYVPQKSATKMMPETFDYVLAKREGENLDTLFTTVFEPYKNDRYIENMETVEIGVAADSEAMPKAADVAKAIKVEHTSGRVDYIVYATNNSVTYDVGGVFKFRGFVGVYTFGDQGEVIYRYVNDGDIIGEDIDKAAAYKGTIDDFTRELSFENYIDVNLSDVETEDLAGRFIYVENDGTENAVYEIKSAEKLSDSKVRLNIGNITLIRNYQDRDNLDKGFAYNIYNGHKFTIPLSFAENFAPVFAPVSDGAVSVGSLYQQVVSAKGYNGAAVTITGRDMPRGSAFDSETNTFLWKPSMTQVGKNHVSLTATDEFGRESVLHFNIDVFGSTSGGGGGGGMDIPSTDDKDDEPKEEEPKEDEPTVDEPTVDEPVDEPTVDVPTEKGFTDIGNYAWAEDAINALAEAGIIKGTSETTFAPQNNITRADYALLLVRAFKLESEQTENFADVSASDYFAKELAIARNTGIVGGIGDNKYAPKNTITRQDMMVILYRALTKLGIELKPVEGIDATSYADYADVADYAQEAVKALIEAGLVNGKSGLIAGSDKTTRAEVAVLLKRILDYIETK